MPIIPASSGSITVSGSGTSYTHVVAGEALAKYNAVYIDLSDSNKAKKAICDGTLAQSQVLGLTTEVVSNGSSGEVIITGVIDDNSWTWIPNKWIYLSTTGTLTQTLTTINGQYAIPIALAITITEIFVQPMTGWLVTSGSNSIGFKAVTFSHSASTFSIVTPPANAIISQVTAIVSVAAGASGATISVGTSGSPSSVISTSVVDLTALGNHSTLPFIDVGAGPSEYIITVTAGGQTFSGTLYFHYFVPNTRVGNSGLASLSFTQATSSPATIFTPTDNAIITRCVVVTDTAASAGSPTASIGIVGNTARDMATTDINLRAQEVSVYEPYTAVGTSPAAIILTITPDSQTFGGRCYITYKVSQ